MIDDTQKNEHCIKLSGKAFLPEPLEIGTNYTLKVSGTITSKTEDDLDNGTHLFSYKFLPVLLDVIEPNGKAIRAKDTRSMSKKLRSVIWKEWSDSQSSKDFEDFYVDRILGIIKRIIEGEL